MANVKFAYQKEQTVEAILYIANKAKDPAFYSVSKLMYLADKLSLERYGRFISGETYVAMEKGPVPSNAYDLMKTVKALRSKKDFAVEGEWKIVPMRPADLDYLSESDVECLDATLKKYGHLSGKDLYSITHDAAYYKGWKARARNSGSHPIPVEAIAEMLPNGKELVDYLQHRYD